MSTQPILDIHQLTQRFDGVTALDAVVLTVEAGETLGVIGPNGAGKSTFVELVSGALTPSHGTIRFAGTDITRLAPPARTRLGVSRTHQIPRPFVRMTVLENVMLAARQARGAEGSGSVRRYSAEILDWAGLADVAQAPAGQLPLLRRKRLELARALALRPRLLLLDEIGAGLAPHETAELIDLLRQLRNDVEAIVIVEHVMEVITACADRTVVLDSGKVLTAGPTRQVLAEPAVAAAYLGTTSPHEPRHERGLSTPHRADRRRQTGHAPLLDIQDVDVAYGGARALRGVSLSISPGEVVVLAGANGAGKTTLAKAISAAVPLSAGRIEFGGRRIDWLAAARVAQLGVAHCMEGRHVFGSLTVEENLLLPADSSPRATVAARLTSTYQLFPALYQLRSRPGTALSGGQQQMLAIGRALMSAPRLVVFDEISLGLAPLAVDRLYQALRQIRDSGVAMLLIDQDLHRALSLADRAYVLVHGEIAATGTPSAIRQHAALSSLLIGVSGSTGTTATGTMTTAS